MMTIYHNNAESAQDGRYLALTNLALLWFALSTHRASDHCRIGDMRTPLALLQALHGQSKAQSLSWDACAGRDDLLGFHVSHRQQGSMRLFMWRKEQHVAVSHDQKPVSHRLTAILQRAEPWIQHRPHKPEQLNGRKVTHSAPTAGLMCGVC